MCALASPYFVHRNNSASIRPAFLSMERLPKSARPLNLAAISGVMPVAFRAEGKKNEDGSTAMRENSLLVSGTPACVEVLYCGHYSDRATALGKRPPEQSHAPTPTIVPHTALPLCRAHLSHSCRASQCKCCTRVHSF